METKKKRDTGRKQSTKNMEESGGVPILKVGTSKQIKESIGKVLNLTIQGQISHRTAGVLFKGLRVAVDATNSLELEQELARIKAKLEELKEME